MGGFCLFVRNKAQVIFTAALRTPAPAPPLSIHLLRLWKPRNAPAPWEGSYPASAQVVTAQVCVHRAQSQSRGWHSVPRAQQPPQPCGCRLRVLCHPLQGSSSCLSHWCIFTLQHLSSFQRFDKMWGEERASKHLCGCISCICNKFLGTWQTQGRVFRFRASSRVWTPNPPRRFREP